MQRHAGAVPIWERWVDVWNKDYIIAYNADHKAVLAAEAAAADAGREARRARAARAVQSAEAIATHGASGAAVAVRASTTAAVVAPAGGAGIAIHSTSQRGVSENVPAAGRGARLATLEETPAAMLARAARGRMLERVQETRTEQEGEMASGADIGTRAGAGAPATVARPRGRLHMLGGIAVSAAGKLPDAR